MAHLAGLLVGLAQGWLDRRHRPGSGLVVGNGSATIATANMAHLAGLLGLAQGWLDRHHRPG
ncbi:hypothetical protein [Aeromonas caviae]